MKNLMKQWCSCSVNLRSGVAGRACHILWHFITHGGRERLWVGGMLLLCAATSFLEVDYSLHVHFAREYSNCWLRVGIYKLHPAGFYHSEFLCASSHPFAMLSFVIQAMEKKDKHTFYRQCWCPCESGVLAHAHPCHLRLFALVVVLAVPLFALRTFCRERSSLSLRYFLSQKVVGAYFQERVPILDKCSGYPS